MVDGRRMYLHVAVWVEHFGPVPPGLEVCHRCDVRNCYEITHLWLGTHAENMADMAAKGRGSNQNKKDPPTHCPAGHPYDEANTYMVRSKQGEYRSCRACRKATQQSIRSRPEVKARRAKQERDRQRRLRQATRTA